MKKYIVIFSAILLLTPFLVLAQTEMAAEPTVEASPITLEDLEVSDPGILPTSKFYFLKNFVRGIKRATTFNPERRAELELNIVNEKAAELKKVSENNADTKGIEKAVANYKENAERLKSRFEALKATSKNPNIDKLLDKLADRTLKHEKLFEELKKKHAVIKDRIDNAKEIFRKTSTDAGERLEAKEKFKERLEKAKDKRKDGNRKKAGERAMKITPTDVATTPVAKQWNIEIKEGNFAPSRLKIRKGDTVVWTNRSASPSWPASGPHPTHTGYPGFDALKGLNTGETYMFTFDRTGNWKYHDHLNPGVTGTILISE